MNMSRLLSVTKLTNIGIHCNQKLIHLCHKRFARHLKELKLKHESRLKTVREIVVERFRTNNGVFDWQLVSNQLIDQRLARKENFEMTLMEAFQSDIQSDQQCGPQSGHQNGDESEAIETFKMNEEMFSSLVEFLQSVPNVRHNSIAASRYCLFISNYADYLNHSHIGEIRHTFDNIMNKYLKNNVTLLTLNECMIALAKSSRDNCLYAMNLLTQFKSFNTNNNGMNILINSAFKYQLYDQVFQLITSNTDLKLNNDTIVNALNSIIEANLNLNQMLNIFEHFSATFIIFEQNIEKLLIRLMTHYGFQTRNAYVERNGLCHNCGTTLTSLSSEEFEHLKSQLRSVIFNKSENLLLASFPEYEKELLLFEKFMENKNFDVILDGLNISYSTSAKYIPDYKNLRTFARVYPLHEIDEHLYHIIMKNNILTQFDNILLIGRKHMDSHKWKKLNTLLAKYNDRFLKFFTLDTTPDDSYLLYAASKNYNTKLISNDFFRDYSDKMENKKLGLLFKRWLQSRQIFFENKCLEFPNEFDYKINIKPNNIHIPLKESTATIIKNNSINWLCCKRVV